MPQSKLIVAVISLLALAAVGGIVYVTFKPDLQKLVTKGVPVTQTIEETQPVAELPKEAQVEDLYSLVGVSNATDHGYVLPAGDGKTKIYVRGIVEKWSGNTLTVQIVDRKSDIQVVDPAKLLCQPETFTDNSGNKIASSEIYIDLNNFKGDVAPIPLSKIKSQFPKGAHIALTADEKDASWQADILVGFGCSL